MRSRVALVVAEVAQQCTRSHWPKHVQLSSTRTGTAHPNSCLLIGRALYVYHFQLLAAAHISSQGRRRTSNVLRLQRRIAQQTQSEHPTTRPPLTLGSTRQRSHGMIPHTSLENRRLKASQHNVSTRRLLSRASPLPTTAPSRTRVPSFSVEVPRSAAEIRQGPLRSTGRLPPFSPRPHPASTIAACVVRRQPWARPAHPRRLTDVGAAHTHSHSVHSYRLFDTRSGMSLLAKLDPTARLSRSARTCARCPQAPETVDSTSIQSPARSRHSVEL